MVAKKTASSPSWLHFTAPAPEIEYGRPFDITFGINWPDSPFVLRDMEVRILVSRRDGKPVANNHVLPLWFRGNIQKRESEPVWMVSGVQRGQAQFLLSGLVFTPESCGHSWDFSFKTTGKHARTNVVYTNIWEKRFSPFTVLPRPGETRVTMANPQDTSSRIQDLDAPNYYQDSLRLQKEKDKAEDRFKNLADAVIADTQALRDRSPLIMKKCQAAGRHIKEIIELMEALEGAGAGWRTLTDLDQCEVMPQAGSKTKRGDAMDVDLDEREAKRQKKA